MNRFFPNSPHDVMDVDPAGGFVMYEEAREIEVDRDIKAANLQLLVKRVLAYKAAFNAFMFADGSSDDVDEADKDMTNLALGLKQ